MSLGISGGGGGVCAPSFQGAHLKKERMVQVGLPSDSRKFPPPSNPYLLFYSVLDMEVALWESVPCPIPLSAAISPFGGIYNK